MFHRSLFGRCDPKAAKNRGRQKASPRCPRALAYDLAQRPLPHDLCFLPSYCHPHFLEAFKDAEYLSSGPTKRVPRGSISKQVHVDPFQYLVYDPVQAARRPSCKHRTGPSMPTCGGAPRAETEHTANMVCQPVGLPFGKAMKELYRQIQKAETLYNEFQVNYDQEMSSIQRYATNEMLKQLWVLRAAGKRFNRASSHIQDQYENQDNSGLEDVELPAARLNRTNKKIRQAMQDALSSNLAEQITCRKSEARIAAVERMREKIEIATGQITGLLQDAIKSRENCEALLRELSHLKMLIDPAKNDDLYEAVDRWDEDEEADADGGNPDTSPSSSHTEAGTRWI